jgi:hypothetical protein
MVPSETAVRRTGIDSLRHVEEMKKACEGMRPVA